MSLPCKDVKFSFHEKNLKKMGCVLFHGGHTCYIAFKINWYISFRLASFCKHIINLRLYKYSHNPFYEFIMIYHISIVWCGLLINFHYNRMSCHNQQFTKCISRYIVYSVFEVQFQNCCLWMSNYLEYIKIIDRLEFFNIIMNLIIIPTMPWNSSFPNLSDTLRMKSR